MASSSVIFWASFVGILVGIYLRALLRTSLRLLCPVLFVDCIIVSSFAGVMAGIIVEASHGNAL